MEKVDIVVIGAGVVGLSVTAHIAGGSRSVLLLDKNCSWGQETSSRNSEVIHAGIYYKPGSLKAEACVSGRKKLYELCRLKNIAHKKLGKLIVARDEHELNMLSRIKDNAVANGVTLELLDKEEVAEMESNIKVEGALYSSETGIVDSHELMKFYYNTAAGKGADICFDSEVTGIKLTEGGYVVTVDNAGETLQIYSRKVINCAGLHADKVAEMAGIDIDQNGYRQVLLKGNYYRVSSAKSGLVTRLVYPVPGKRSLGIHTVPDLVGQMRLGPDAEPVLCVDYTVMDKKEEFFRSASTFLPWLDKDDLNQDMAGIRPQLMHGDADGFRDFIINEETAKGLPGMINMIGIESPGLTSSVFLGEHVAQMALREDRSLCLK